MNWNAIGAVAELLGALGVILSLAYLALQVRHSTNQMRLNSESLGMAHEMGGAEMSIAIAMEVVRDADLADLLRRARDVEAPLSQVERFRWGTYLWSSLTVFQAGHQNHRKGLADSDAWEGHRRQMVAMMDCSGARAWWQHARGRFSDPFAEYLDRELEGSAGA